MIENRTVRNDRVRKICPFCGHEFLGDKDDGELFCDEHRGDCI